MKRSPASGLATQLAGANLSRRGLFKNPAAASGPQLEGAWAPIALVAANLFVVFFGASWGPLVWVLLGEIFPNSIRARALGVAAAAQWLANFVVSTTFPPMAARSRADYFDAGLRLLAEGGVQA